MKKELYILTTLILLVSTVSAFKFCEDGTQNEDNIRIVSVDDMLKENSAEWAWKNNQEVELEVRVQNREDKEKTLTAEIVFVKDGDEVEIAKDSEDLKEEIKLSAKSRESIVFNFDTEKDVEEGEYEVFVKLYKSGDEDEECVENSETNVEVSKVKICDGDEVDDSKLEIKKINDYTKNVDEEWTWTPGKKVKVSVEVKNKDYSKREFGVELVFLDDKGNEVNIVEDSGDLIEETTLEEDEENEVAFDLELKTDIEDEYELYAKAYDLEDSDICTSLQAEDDSNQAKIKIEWADVDVQIKEVIGPKIVEKGIQTQYTVEVMNIGSEDQEKVKVIMFDSKLNIKEEKVIENLESGETRTITFQATVPESVNETKGNILFTLEFDYNENKDYYKKALGEESDVQLRIDLMENTNKEIEENKTVEESNETTENTNETEVNNTEPEDSSFTDKILDENTNAPITGNVVGSSSKNTYGWLYAFIAAVLVAGLFVYYRRTKKKSPKKIKEYSTKEYIEPKFTTRKYTASLHSDDD